MGDPKFYVARRQRDFVNRLAVALAQLDIDFAPGWTDKA